MRRTVVRWLARSSIVLCLSAWVLSLGAIVDVLHWVDAGAPRKAKELAAVERDASRLGKRLRRLEQRARLQAWIQQQIRKTNPRLEPDQARYFGQLLLEATDKYPGLDPLFFLAVGIVESHFDPQATSGAQAKGLYQIWPPTGRSLAKNIGWEFSEAMLYQPEENTELAALYLDELFTIYGDPRLVLADYNGGPVNAERLRVGSAELASETEAYVIKVLSVLQSLNERLPPGTSRSGNVNRPTALLD